MHLQQVFLSDASTGRHPDGPREDGADKADRSTDGQIDALVYELYALTEEEIGIVEAASK
jgi:hypothetical protein